MGYSDPLMHTLDKFDHAILNTLQADARITLTALANKVGLSKTPCQIRMKRLESHGYILGYCARLNHSKLGQNHIAFAQVTLKQTNSQALTIFNQAINMIPAVEQCHMIAGSFDYLVKVRTRNMEEYRAVLGEKISALPNVLQSSTFGVMESVKDS